MLGKNKAFAHFGATGKNPVWSWSARTPDDKTVVLTMWEDQFDRPTDPRTYSNFGSDGLCWIRANGNRERIENIRWAKAHCDGKVRVVVTRAKEIGVYPRSIAAVWPDENMIMQITSFNEQTGEFTALRVDT